MHDDAMLSTPTPKAVRVTVPVSPEVLEIFQRLAKAGGMSTGRAMGEWMTDTVEAAELMASTMERARAAPKLVTAELHAMMLGMTDQTKELADKYAKFKGAMAGGPADGDGKRSAAAAAGHPAPVPPPCNTGGKVPGEGKPKRGVKSSLKPGFPLPPAKVQAYANTNGKPPKASK